MQGIRTILEKHNCDGMLISDYFNILYLTGLRTMSPAEREAFVVVTAKHFHIITDRRYSVEGKAQSIIWYIDKENTVLQMVQRIIKEEGIQTLGIESNNITLDEQKQLECLDVKMKPLSYLFQGIRSIKTKDEFCRIRKACTILDEALEHLKSYIRIGMTEREVAWELERTVRIDYKAELAFAPIVAVDEHSSIPHYDTYQGGKKQIQKGSLLLIDAGVRFDNYCSDITRMFAMGVISDEIKKAYADLLKTQRATISHISAITELRDIDDYCRKLLQSEGYEPYPHSTGHGIGLEVHENPRVRHLSSEQKQPGHVFTIEPGIYIKDKWGMRVEDTLFINSSGFPEVLTHFPKELVEL